MSGEAGLALAVDRVQEEKARVARQRALVQELRRKGHDLKLATELLISFEQALAGARDELEVLRHGLAAELAHENSKRMEEPEALEA
jgi:hypothetical protein